MSTHINNPLIVLAIALVAQSVAVFVGDFFRKRTQHFRREEQHDFDTVRTATMTLLALMRTGQVASPQYRDVPHAPYWL
jgi:hypothetical protein